MALAHDLFVFDLDGTLVDSLPDIAAALNEALSAADLPMHHLDAVRGFLGDGARELVRRAAGPQPSEAAIDELVVDYRARYATQLVARTRPYDGVVELLARLPRAAVLTNKPGREARRIVDELGLGSAFVAVVGEGDGHPRKPDPTALRALVATHGARRAVYIGDSHVDAITAERAGIDFVFVTWGYGRVEGPHRRVAAPMQLLSPGS
jgi:phosphoglycolate phosphatase